MSGQLPQGIVDALRSGQDLAVETLGQPCLLYRVSDRSATNPNMDPTETYTHSSNRRIENRRVAYGDGDQTEFTGMLEAVIYAGTVSFTDGVQIVVDGETPGDGTLTLNRTTGVYSLTFNDPPAAGTPVLVTYHTDAPLATVVWIEWKQPRKLPNVGFGNAHEETLHITAYFRCDLKVQFGEWFKLPEQFAIGKVYYSQFIVTGRGQQGQDRQGLESFRIAPNRRHRTIAGEAENEAPPTLPNEVSNDHDEAPILEKLFTVGGDLR